MPDRNANSSTLRCYRCGASLAGLSLPLARLDLCPDCGVELHVCRMCHHYAPSLPDSCDEDDAADVRDKTAANFCDYFAPNTDAFDGREQRAEAAAKLELEALFDGASPADADDKPATDASLEEAEKLFRN